MSATALATVLSALALGSGTNGAQAHAQMSEKDIATATRSYEIPAGRMSTALNRLADESGVEIVYDSGLTRALTTRGLAGPHTLSAALQKLLLGTGLNYELSADGKSALIVLAQAGGTQTDASGAAQLPPIEIGAEGPPQAAPERTMEAAGSNNGPGTSQGGAGLGGRFTGYNVVGPAVATKDNIPLMQSPVNVQVVTREVVDDQQDITVRDAIFGNVSSVQPPSTTNDSNNFYDGFNIRGFDNANIFRNNLRVWEVSNIETANLQSIEVLKGPAAMLFGRLEPGGIVNLVVKRPLETPYFSVQEQAGSWGQTRTTVDASGPLTPDKTWLYRVNLDYSHSDSFVDSVTNQNAFIGATITYHPIEQFRFNFDTEYQNTIFVDNTIGIPAIGNRPAPIPISRYLEQPAFAVDNPNRQERELIGYDWTYDINKDWSLTNRFAYSNIDYRQRLNGNDSFNQATGVMNINLWDAWVDAQTISTNLDLKGKFTTGPLHHDVMIGADYWYLDKNIEAFGGDSPFVTPISIYAPSYALSGNFAQPPNSFYPLREYWKGIYAQDMVSLWDDKLHFLFGGRYDWAEIGNGYSSNSNAEATGPYNPITGVGLPFAWDKAFSPRLGAVLTPTPWFSFYGNFTRSFGVTNAVPIPGQPIFPPQTAQQFEGGVKIEFFDKRLTTTLAFYDITKTNIAQAVGGGSPFSTNVGRAESKGVEFDISGRINENWSLIGNYSHDDARIIQGMGISNNCGPGISCVNYGTFVNESGNRLQNVPLNAGNIWVKYDADGNLKGLSLGGGLNINGLRQGDNQNTFQLPAYTLVNAMVLYRFRPEFLPGVKNLTAQFNVKNLFNTTYYQNSSTNMSIFPGQPRTFMVSLRAEY